MNHYNAEPNFDARSEAWEKAAYDYDLDMSHEYMEEEVRQAFEGRSADSIRAYLGTYGGAVTDRVEGAIKEARDLLAAGHPGPATLLSATAVELIVSHLVIRPIVQGAFLSDQWAAVLADQILRGKTDDMRRLLPIIAAAWNLDLDEVRLPGGGSVWGTFTGSVTPARNAFVHRAEPVSAVLAAQAIECAQALLDGLVVAVAVSIGMNWPANPWHQAYAVDGITVQMFEPRDPFAMRAP